MLPDVLRSGISNVIAGDGNGLRFGEDIRIARRNLLQRIGANLDILEVRLTIGTGGSGYVHGVSLVTGAVQPEGEARPAAVIDRLTDHQTAGLGRIHPGQGDVCMEIVRAASGQYRLVGWVLPDGECVS